MLRDTAAGYRYLKRDAPTVVRRARRRSTIVPELAARAASVRTLAAGVIIDPNISVPLPFAGLSYVNFDLFGTGTQLNAFFGGSYVQAAFSTPSVGGSRWQLAGRAFGIATSYNDRSFRGGTEIYDENIRQRPAHASVWLLRPLTPRALAPPGIRTGLHSPPGGAGNGARVRRSGRPGAARREDRDRRSARRVGRIALVEPGAAQRLGAVGARPATTIRRTRTLQRYGASLSRSMPLTSAGRGARVEGRSDGGHRARPFQPLLVRHVRQPVAWVSSGADPLRPRRRAARRGRLAGRDVLQGWTDSWTPRTCATAASAPAIGTTPGSGAALEAPGAVRIARRRSSGVTVSEE